MRKRTGIWQSFALVLGLAPVLGAGNLSSGVPTPLRPATVTWGGVSNNEQFALPNAQTDWEYTARHMDAMFLHGAYWMIASGPEWEANCKGLGQVLVRHGKKAHVETGFGEGPGFDPANPEKRQPYKTAMSNAARIRELKERFGIAISKVRADWFPMFAMAAYAQRYQLRDDHAMFLAMVTGADDVFGPYPAGFSPEIGNWRDYVSTLNRELPGIEIAFDQAPCNHRRVEVPEVRARVPWPALGYGYTRSVAMLNQPPVQVSGKPVEVKFDFADQFMGALIASRSANVNFTGFEGDTPYNYLTDGPKDFPKPELTAYLLAIERMVHGQGKRNGRIINDCGPAYGDADQGWVRVDLGKPVDIDRIRIGWGQDGPADGVIQTSLDDQSYAGWAKTPRPPAAGADVDYAEKKVRMVRYIKWSGRKRATPRGFQVRSLEAYGPGEPGRNLALGYAVAESSVHLAASGPDGKPRHRKECITDGDPSTYWESNFIDNDAWDQRYHDRSLEYLEYYQSVGGRADEYIAESWYAGPFTFFPETKPGAFTNLARDVLRRIQGLDDEDRPMPLDLAVRWPGREALTGQGIDQPTPAHGQALSADLSPGESKTWVVRVQNQAKERIPGDARATPLLRAELKGGGLDVRCLDSDQADVTHRVFAREGSDGLFLGGLEPGEYREIALQFRAGSSTGASCEVRMEVYWNPQDPSLRPRDSLTIHASVRQR